MTGAEPPPGGGADQTDPQVRSLEWWWGLLLRVGLYLLTAAGCLVIIPGGLAALFGTVVGATLGIFLTGLFANLLVLRVFDRRSLLAIGLQTSPASGRNFLWGLLLGAGAAVALLAGPLLLLQAHLVPSRGAGIGGAGIVFFLLTLLFGAGGEELLFHGYVFQLLVEKIGPFATILPVSVLFGSLHGWNPHASPLGVINTVLWGILLGYAFLRSRDLWLLIGLHYGWNVTLPLFGVNLSGLTIGVSRYAYQWDLPTLWSGGDYGPEAGLLTTALLAGLFVAVRKAPIAPQYAAIAVSLNEDPAPV